MNKIDLSHAVITLHGIAGLIEQEIGVSILSLNVRKAADQLSDYLKTTKDLERQQNGNSN